jgi:2-amino-4-hydroxy-6-hydroxymethyldihydropteridine diphosphokinase
VDRAVAPASRLAAISLGSNLGDRREAIDFAIARLSRLLSDVSFSDCIETDPEAIDGGPVDQPLYLNAVLVGTTALEPRALLAALLDIEREFGRERPYAGAARTLDLDLILLGDAVIEEADLQLPHPRFRRRFFVLGPLAEIAPDLRDPVTGLRVGELLRALLRDEAR